MDLYRDDGVWVMPDIKRGSRVSPYKLEKPLKTHIMRIRITKNKE